ncbi:MAG TPA: L,D-transpeptidase family protein, partial [Vicinamibacteria bacterium]
HLSDLHRGRVDPRAVGFGYDAHGPDPDLVAVLRRVRDDGSIEPAAAGIEPQYAVYQRLKQALPRFMALAKDPPLALASEVKKLAPGDEYASLEELAARLRAFGDLGLEEPVSGRYEGPLVDAVKRLQDRFGLEADGILGRDTFRALNRDPQSLAEQLQLALERLRWLPDLRQRDVVVVNIPAFRMWVLESDRAPSLTMRVVVGKAFRHDTPIFYGEMRYVTFRPYWNVPYSIATRELLPKIRSDRGYLDREQMEIVSLASPEASTYPPTPENLDAVKRGTLRIRQRPGPKNALGRVVFSFPNDDHIFMHDTPTQSVFARSRRDFSHGCIRLEDPVALLRFVLRDQPEWTEERMAAALEGDRPVWVGLTKPLPVVIFYATAFVDSQGVTRFGDDIYGLDERLRKALARGYPYPRTPLR